MFMGLALAFGSLSLFCAVVLFVAVTERYSLFAQFGLGFLFVLFMGLSGLMFNASICGIRCIGTSIANGEPQAEKDNK